MTSTAASHPPIRAPLSELTTARLDLRRFQASDLDALARVFAQTEVWHFPYRRAFTREETRSFIETQQRAWETCGFGLWVARELEGERAIGYVGLSVPSFLPEVLPAVEVGWRFEPAAWGKGYASEGATAALVQAFTTLGLSEVCSLPQSANLRSVAVCDRIGMTFDRELTIPATERRGPVRAKLYKARHPAWQEPAPRG